MDLTVFAVRPIGTCTEKGLAGSPANSKSLECWCQTVAWTPHHHGDRHLTRVGNNIYILRTTLYILSLDWPNVCDLPVFIFRIISKYPFLFIICSTALHLIGKRLSKINVLYKIAVIKCCCACVRFQETNLGFVAVIVLLSKLSEILLHKDVKYSELFCFN